ncbi:B12-binding domain-containing radical SAM protein [Candidatus Sumerlaeota bacterium]|nr:B12-binding domain-containing radical SAM protein [Candidatus Sumerlaeota bacterium]
MRVLLLSIFDEWCLGLRLLTSLLRREGHEVSLAFLGSIPQANTDAGANDPEGYHVPPASVSGGDLEALRQLTGEFKPELIGVSYTSHYFGLAERATVEMRRASDAPVIWGGVDVTANPDLAIQIADFACVGEGEGAMMDLVHALTSGEDCTGIPNLWVRRDGEIHRNDVRPVIRDLDALPYPDFIPAGRDWIAGGRVNRATIPDGSNLHHSYPIMASRGCPFSCTYCCNSMYREIYGSRDYVRLRSVDSVVDEIRGYLRHRPETTIIEFWDDVFGFNEEWMREFAEVYPREVKRPFWCYTYPVLCRPEFVERLRRAGVSFVVMGLQSGSERTLREDYNRPASAKQAIDAAWLMHRSGITPVVDLILGNPFETDEDYLKTLEMMLQMPPGFILQEINVLSLYRNYPLTRRAGEAGLRSSPLDRRNVFQGEPLPDLRFWHALLTLTQFPQVGADNLRHMARDPHLREHPEIVEAISRALVDATFIPGTRRHRTQPLQEEIDGLRKGLATYEGSAAVRWFLKLRRALRGRR